MDTTTAIKDFAERFGDVTYPQFIGDQMKRCSVKNIQRDIYETYAKFPEEVRERLDDFIERYTEKFFNPAMCRFEMYIIVQAEAENLRAQAPIEDISDEQIIDVLMITMMKITRYAHVDRKFRKMLGIRKGLLG